MQTKMFSATTLSMASLLFAAQAVIQPQAPGTKTEWAMHHIDRQYWNHNSLGPGDVDRDGYTDYVVIHEGPDLYTIDFHPGKKSGDVREPWAKVVIAAGYNVEYAVFGDMDGDGNLDIVGVEGDSPKSPAGIRILWGPEPGRARDAKAWKEGELIPGTIDRGHWLYTQARDINGDGVTDIIAGSRTLARNGRSAGIVWIEAPRDPKLRRDVSRWVVHDIDPTWQGGHGFIFADINNDGHDDIVACNSDWDTTFNQKTIAWFENPGPKSSGIARPWKIHVIRTRMWDLYSKSQLATADFNHDGLLDVVVQTDNYVYLFEQVTGKPDTWTKITILKPEITRWLARPTKIADLNGDGKPDIVGALIHNMGFLPAGKATVFWMEFTGDQPTADNWITHPVKWSDHSETYSSGRGEKWDHLSFIDVNGDGLIDIVGNAEEHYDKDHKSILGVVWFESPGKSRSR